MVVYIVCCSHMEQEGNEDTSLDKCYVSEEKAIAYIKNINALDDHYNPQWIEDEDIELSVVSDEFDESDGYRQIKLNFEGCDETYIYYIEKMEVDGIKDKHVYYIEEI